MPWPRPHRLRSLPLAAHRPRREWPGARPSPPCRAAPRPDAGRERAIHRAGQPPGSSERRVRRTPSPERAGETPRRGCCQLLSADRTCAAHDTAAAAVDPRRADDRARRFRNRAPRPRARSASLERWHPGRGDARGARASAGAREERRALMMCPHACGWRRCAAPRGGAMSGLRADRVHRLGFLSADTLTRGCALRAYGFAAARSGVLGRPSGAHVTLR